MSNLFNILDGMISNIGDFEKDRAEIESRLSDLDYIQSYAEACDENITSSDAALIRDAGIAWVRDVNEGNGEWSRMRGEAEQALA